MIYQKIISINHHKTDIMTSEQLESNERTGTGRVNNFEGFSTSQLIWLYWQMAIPYAFVTTHKKCKQLVTTIKFQFHINQIHLHRCTCVRINYLS